MSGCGCGKWSLGKSVKGIAIWDISTSGILLLALVLMLIFGIPGTDHLFLAATFEEKTKGTTLVFMSVLSCILMLDILLSYTLYTGVNEKSVCRCTLWLVIRSMSLLIYIGLIVSITQHSLEHQQNSFMIKILYVGIGFMFRLVFIWIVAAFIWRLRRQNNSTNSHEV